MGDRPLFRRLVKLGATLTGPATAHRQDIWPGLTIDRTTGQVAWRGQPLTRLVPFGDIVPSQPPLIAIVGSGPSLAQQYPERLPKGSVILLNGAVSLVDRLTPLAAMVEDERFVFRHIEMLAALPKDIPLMLSPAALRAVAERDTSLLRHRKIALIDNILKPVNGCRRPLTDPQLDSVLVRGAATAALSRNPDQGVFICGTVALSAVQVALTALSDQIVLAGIDLTNATQPRFYEAAGFAAPSGIVEGLDRIMAGFTLGRQLAQAQNTEFLCASPVSALLGIGIPETKMLS